MGTTLSVEKTRKKIRYGFNILNSATIYIRIYTVTTYNRKRCCSMDSYNEETLDQQVLFDKRDREAIRDCLKQLPDDTENREAVLLWIDL